MKRVDWGRVAPLLERLLELPVERRREWLGAECGSDAVLLRAAWNAYEDAVRDDGFLASPFTGEVREPAESEAGGERRIGPYRLVRVLGSGGMGTVWLAERDDGQYRQRVALKLVKRGMDTDAVVRRFRVERQVLAELEHPRIARLLDGGSTEQGLPYLVMELVEGRPLLDHCAEERLDVQARLRLFQKVCETVQFAHERQVVHRDLKPSNVLVTAAGEPKLLDFGIAKVLEAGQDAAALELTRTGERFLSPRYASPEQLRGAPVGPASDVYALGVILYELLTALHPHGWTTTSWSEFELDVLQRDPAPPSRAVLLSSDVEPPPEGRRARSRRLRGDLDTIVLTALRKEPERRYASAHALALDLGRHLAGHPVHARPDTLPYRLAKYVGRNRGLVAGAGAFVLLLSVALAVTLRLYRDSLRAEQAAQWEAYVGHVAAAENALANARVAEARAHLDLAPEDLRGWEWWHLGSRLDRARRSPDVPGEGVFALDATFGRLAVAEGSEIALLDLETLAPLLRTESVGPRPPGTWRGGVSLAFSAEGRWLASAWQGGDLFVHDLHAGGRLAWRGEAGVEHTRVAFHPARPRLVVGRKNGALCELDPTSGAVRASLDAHAREISALAFDAGGRWLASGAWDHVVRLWEADGLALRHELRGHTMAVNSAAFSPDGARLATTSLDGTLRLWDVATGAALATHGMEGGFDGDTLFDPSGERLLVALRGGIAVLDARTQRRLALWLGHESHPTRLALDPTRGRVWSRAKDELKEWSLDTEDVRVLRTCEYGSGAVFDPKGGRLASVGPDGRLRLWSWPQGEPLGEHVAPGGRLADLSFHPGRDVLHTLDERGSLAVWDPSEGRLHQRSPPVDGVDVPTGKALIGAASGELLACFLGPAIELRAGDGALVRRIEPPPGERLLCASLDASGTLVAAGTVAGRTVVFDAHPGTPRSILERPTPDAGMVMSVAFHGDLLASAFDTGTIALWDAVTGRARAVMTECRMRIDALAFHPDGRRLASGSMDGTIRLWDVASGRLVATLGGHTVRIDALDFAPDGSALLSGSDDGTLRLWETTPFR